MADADDVMPMSALPATVDFALLPINGDADVASWMPLVRAAVRRTRQQLFILFTGASTSCCTLIQCQEFLECGLHVRHS